MLADDDEVLFGPADAPLCAAFDCPVPAAAYGSECDCGRSLCAACDADGRVCSDCAETARAVRLEAARMINGGES